MPKIYVIMCQCDDSYYPGHISQHKRAFASLEAAEAFLSELNGPGDDDYTQQYGPMFYLSEVELQS